MSQLCEDPECPNPDASVWTIVPLARPGGCHDTILCVNCATKHGLWCERHREPHMGIGGTTHHVCGKCLAEGIAAIADIDVLQRWLDALPRDGYVILERTCRTAAELHLCANDPAHWARWILVVAALQNGEATHDRLLALEKEVEETHNLMLLMPTWAIEQYEQADG